MQSVETIGNATSVIGFQRISLSLIGQYGVNVPKWEKDGSALFQGTGLQFVGETRNSPAYTRKWFQSDCNPCSSSSTSGIRIWELLLW